MAFVYTYLVIDPYPLRVLAYIFGNKLPSLSEKVCWTTKLSCVNGFTSTHMHYTLKKRMCVIVFHHAQVNVQTCHGGYAVGRRLC